MISVDDGIMQADPVRFESAENGYTGLCAQKLDIQLVKGTNRKVNVYYVEKYNPAHTLKYVKEVNPDGSISDRELCTTDRLLKFIEPKNLSDEEYEELSEEDYEAIKKLSPSSDIPDSKFTERLF